MRVGLDNLPEPLDDLVILMIQTLVDRVELPVLHIDLVEPIENHFKFCYGQPPDISLANQAVEALNKCLQQLLLLLDTEPVGAIKSYGDTYMVKFTVG